MPTSSITEKVDKFEADHGAEWIEKDQFLLRTTSEEI